MACQSDVNGRKDKQDPKNPEPLGLEVRVLSKVRSSAVIGIDAYLVDVEVDISHGLPSFATVGLPETAVRESKERVKAAIQNSGYPFPDDRITVNLAPAAVKKEGTGLDLPIALGILSALGIVSAELLGDLLIMGELSLDGRIKRVRGSLPMAIAARDAGFRGIVLPEENGLEASVVSGIQVLPAASLGQVIDYMRGLARIEPVVSEVASLFDLDRENRADFSEVMGQEHVKRALEIAAAGAHNVLMVGPPGSGKTMLSRRIGSILPPMGFEEAVETTKIFSVVGLLPRDQALITERPFRAPHHTISDAGLIGGGHVPRPGEVSLAHNGVLFLDELPEFKKHVLEVLRQPLEDRQVTISRATTTLSYPASFMLVAAMNPCPCGFLSDPRHPCTCSPQQISRYRSRISGPLLDRMDIQVEVPAVAFRDLIGETPSEPSSAIRERVSRARDIQARRFKRASIFTNSQMAGRHIRSYCAIDSESSRLLEMAVDRLGLSARAFNRIIKIARTIADLAGEADIRASHISEAIQYRTLDRRGDVQG